MNKKDAIQRLFEPDIKAFVEVMRPEELEIRKKLDIGYTFEKQDLIISEIRPGWKQNSKGDFEYDFEKKLHSPRAKAKFVKSQNLWKIYWKRANNKWEAYKPHPVVETLAEFFNIIKEDDYGCFWG